MQLPISYNLYPILLVLFIFGACIGSFLNALNYRVVKGKSFLGRSFCPHCKKKLSAGELIPILSYLVQKGHCTKCKKPISPRYPLVELATALGFVAVGLKVYFDMPTNQLLAHDSLYLTSYILNILILVSVFIGVAAADLSWGIIPDLLVFPAVGFNFLFRVFDIAYPNTQAYFALQNAGGLGPYLLKSGYLTKIIQTDLYQFGFALLLGAGIAGFFLALIYFTRGRAMGLGDVKLGFLIGLALGFPAGLIALFLAFLTGASASVILIMLGKKRFGETVPFGPFLSLGALAGLFFGPSLLNSYLNLFK